MRKSISNERTFSATGNESFLYKKLVDLAEMLSAEMEEEGLSGRTLTLKLKTASFEIRTRAVTLPKHIASKEEIFKHASKLLKAELPVSLRLIGLRVSQFMEENANPSDPTQRTLSNFVVQGDVAREEEDDHVPSCSDISENPFTGDTCSDFPTKSSEISQRDKVKVNVCEPSDASNSSRPSTELQLEVAANETGHCSDDHEEFLVWLDGYKCSLCGIEMPPGFIEERREHSDFHVAQRLQDEESNDNYRLLTPNKQRSIQNGAARNGGGQRKKKKLSPASTKCIPIDSFFVKTNQNF
ncbi:unnamed protein product [Cuscuta campestris]|nr:unnamed protein product [Cuscuta campestris]